MGSSPPVLIGETTTINCLVNMRAANELLADIVSPPDPLSVDEGVATRDCVGKLPKLLRLVVTSIYNSACVCVCCTSH